jgi:hypothetical protein
MKSIQRAHVVVVADSDEALFLAARIFAMDVAKVTSVAGFDEAQGMCQAGGADACVAAFDECVPNAAPVAEKDAPGRHCGVPSLLIVPVATPYLRKIARRGGYMTAVPASIASRVLYRHIGAALQLRRAAGRRRRVPKSIVVAAATLARAASGKPTLH